MEIGSVALLGENLAELPSQRLSLQLLAGGEAPSTLASDVRRGLYSLPKFLPPKYFYDTRGSFLFEQICDTPEYYPTRTEDALLAQYACEVIARIRPRTIVELGSGSSRKTRHFFDACEREDVPARYMPLDVCGDMLVHAAQDLMSRYRWLQIAAVVGDYSAGIDSLPSTEGPRLFLFLGGTLGNFGHAEAVKFLWDIRCNLRERDALLIGVDRVKDPQLLHAAYNDAQGYTARFNLNVLEVLNRELNGDFDPADFRHEAFYNEPRAQIEMHLRAQRDHLVDLHALDMRVPFRAGETIRTEISRKFTPESLTQLLGRAGLYPERHYQADGGAYSLVLARGIV